MLLINDINDKIISNATNDTNDCDNIISSDANDNDIDDDINGDKI